MTEHSHDPGCIFCKIVAGQIPSAKVLETDQVIAFLDIGPVNHGHTLLIPRSHHAQLADLPDAIAAEIGALLPRLCRAVKQAAGVESLNVIVNNGQDAGQTVDHVHWHFIPRFAGDPVHWPWPHGSYTSDELAEIRARIERALTPS